MKLTKEGIAVIEGDEYLSKDIETQGRLDVARDFLLQFKQYIPEGGTVIDVGACLGDYTVTFAEFVGPKGSVYAFEPNPIVWDCLVHNIMKMPNVYCFKWALGASDGIGVMNLDLRNIGASWFSSSPVQAKGQVNISVDCIPVHRLDDWVGAKVDFIKLDAEGYEPWILDGGKATIIKYRPVMLIEIDTRALGFQGFKPEDVYMRLDALNYDFPRFEGPHGDILCVPKERA
jgi:FkbM family methyltransferase